MVSNKGHKLNKEALQGCLDCSLDLKAIAIRFNCNSITVTNYLKKFGLKSDFKKNLKIDIEELYKLRVLSCWNYEDLAELYKGSQAGIRKICERSNFLRPKIKRLQSLTINKVEVKKINKKYKVDKSSILLQELLDSL